MYLSLEKCLKENIFVSKKAKSYFIDTNIFLRALTKDDLKAFGAVIELLQKIKGGYYKAYTSSLVLAEIAWVLGSYYKLKKLDVVKALDSITSLNGLQFIEGQDIVRALELYRSLNVKFIDCLISTTLVSHPKDWIIVSYDKDFDKLKILRLEPQEL